MVDLVLPGRRDASAISQAEFHGTIEKVRDLLRQIAQETDKLANKVGNDIDGINLRLSALERGLMEARREVAELRASKDWKPEKPKRGIELED